MSQQDLNCCSSDLFFLEMLVVPPCRYLRSAIEDTRSHNTVSVYRSVVHTPKKTVFVTITPTAVYSEISFFFFGTYFQ